MKTKKSKWKKIDNGNYPNYSGVYKIRLYDTKENKPYTLKRFLAEDKEGILMIGQTEKTFKERIRNFKQAYKIGKRNHSEGVRLNKIYNQVKKEYENCELQYSCEKLQGKKIKEKEEKLLWVYFKKFGEVPPINQNLPKRTSLKS